MKPLLSSLASIAIVAACTPSTEPAQTGAAAPLTAAEQAFVSEVEALRTRHGDAAARFALADIGSGATTRLIPQPVFECSYDDFGLILGCDRVDEQ
jgi:hypothetical protein